MTSFQIKSVGGKAINGPYRCFSTRKFAGGDSGAPVMAGGRIVGLVNNSASVTRLSGISTLKPYIAAPTPAPTPPAAAPITAEQIEAMSKRYAGKRVSTGLTASDTVAWDDVIALMERL